MFANPAFLLLGAVNLVVAGVGNDICNPNNCFSNVNFEPLKYSKDVSWNRARDIIPGAGVNLAGLYLPDEKRTTCVQAQIVDLAYKFDLSAKHTKDGNNATLFIKSCVDAMRDITFGRAKEGGCWNIFNNYSGGQVAVGNWIFVFTPNPGHCAGTVPVS